MMRPAKIISILLSLWMTPCLLLAEDSRIKIDIDEHATGIAVPSEFLGLSMETSALLRKGTGEAPYLKADNHALIQLFKTLGIKNLRIGGNTADRPTLPVPNDSEIDDLFGFAKAADVKVIYTLRLRDSSIETVTQSAKYLMGKYADQIDCLAIGNEPNVYEHEYAKYSQDEKAYMAAVHAAVPQAKFCGPGTNITGDAPWANGYIKDFNKDPNILWLTQHAYPGGNSRKVPDPATGRARMLSHEFEEVYQKSYAAFGPAAQASGMKYRLEETNSYYNGGAEEASNTFASTLWALDYLYFWLTHNAQGVNFHTGNKVAAGEIQTPCWYATFWDENGTLDVRPIAYAIKAFDLAARGKLLTVHLSTTQDQLKAYATLSQDKTTYFTLINKNYGSNTHDVELSLHIPRGYSRVETMALSASQGDIATTSGVTLGGGLLQSDGTWNGKWTVKAQLSRGGFVDLSIPSASAMLIRLTR